jgi:hypothetical protein
MPMSPDEMSDRQLLLDIHSAVIELNAIVMGVNGKGGLFSDLQTVKLAVTEMTLRTRDSEVDVAHVIKDLMELEPRIEALDNEIHEKNGGILSRLDITEIKQRDNRSILSWGAGVILTFLMAILGVLIAHLENG